MQKIIYYKSGNYDSYSMNIKDMPSNHPLGYLAEFFIRDLRDVDIDYFIKWIDERKYVPIDSTNWEMYSAILENGMINIDPIIYDETVEHGWPCNCNIFKTTREKMINILKRYKEVRAIRPLPHKIVFTQDDNGDVTINAEN